MKKFTTLLMTLFFSSVLMAQLPSGSFFEFEFTGGSLANTSSSGAPNFTGSISSIADRNGSANDAADITGTLSGASVGATNVNEMTLSFWMKHAPINSNERILQIYGTWGNGFRLQMDGNQLLYDGKAGNNGGSPSNSESEAVNIDDNAWHHIAVRTTLIGTDTLEFDVFVDNVLQANLSNTTINVGGAITHFLSNATLVISPTNNYGGDIDDIYFYKSALTDAQITQLYLDKCIVNIPDSHFKAYLVGNAAINTNGDTEIQCSEASAFTGTINCTNQNISNLTGIEAFTSLTKLFCITNSITNIDLSQNTALTELNCSANSLTALNVSQNVNLTKLECSYNNISSIGLSTNTSLEVLDVSHNQISNINTSTNTLLEVLRAGNNTLTSIDVSANTSLIAIEVNNNQLSSIDVSSNTNLLNLYAQNNSITGLDISLNTALNYLDISNNSLTSLNVANGNNTNFYDASNGGGSGNPAMDARQNAGLSCIKIDAGFTPPNSPASSRWEKDAAASYSSTCAPPCLVTIPDANFKAYLVGNALINTNGNTEIECSEASAFSGTMNCGNLSISDLTGIESFTALTRLYCDNNLLTVLDLSNNTSLTTLECRNNSISSLDVSQNNALEYLLLNNNSMTTLDVSQNNSLLWLRCNDNNLTNLDVSNNTNLTQLLCNSNALVSLNVSNNNNLNLLNLQALGNSSLTCIQHDSGFNPASNANWLKDATASWSTNCPPPCTVNIPDANFKAYLVGNALINTNGNTEIECSEASSYTGQINAGSLSIADLTGIEAFTEIIELNCNNNSLTSLDISQNTDLITLRAGNNSLGNLDISQNTALTFVETNSNSLTNLDLSQNVNLTEVYCLNNSITSLDLSQNTDLYILNCNNNSLTNLDVSQNPDLYYLFCENNSLTGLDVSQNTDLNRLSFNSNLLNNIDLSQNLDLVRLTCMDNLLDGNLDISANTNINFFNCSDNLLTGLNVANGNNTNFNTFNANFNSNLTCIQVDDETYSTANWPNIDATASFSNSCIVLVSSINVQGQNGVSSITTQGGTLQMEAIILPANADDMTYTWSVNNSNASISSTGVLTALADGTVEVTATANDASGITATKTITISNQSVGINDVVFENLNIFPNPTNGIINLNVSEKISSIKIMDLTGKTIKEFNAEAKQLDISGFTTGIYFLEISNADRKSVVKVVKK